MSTPTPATRAASASAVTVDEAAQRLAVAAEHRQPCPPVRDLIGSDDLQAAYAVQRRNAEARVAAGAEVVGRKIGLTSPAVQAQLGVDQPDFGILFADMAHADGAAVPPDAVMQPRVEAEVAFVLKAELADGLLDDAQVRTAVDYAVAALEVCGSRIAGWDISFGDTVADNASAGAYVLGTEKKTLDEFVPRDVEMSMTVDGEEVSTGKGAACLGDPLNALAWLARQARDLGEPLRAGQVILSGALGPMKPIEPGAQVQAHITGLGSVSMSLASKEQ
ncbi:2-keto-4-pentenoate hydratase [Nocardioides terrigena]|uniref:2-keto-4-pentenoate hydratase n=1 Tax=Nocardioides terrigena TaxID=424797 RepID=UPI000D31CB54|nr:fumarylacetoacetate hydrolase family protein [Nocardioides terrigena]